MSDAPRPGPGPTSSAPEARPVAPGAGSPRAQAAAALVGALSKAARAFTLYDPGNALVRDFIADYRAKAEAATAGGPVRLELRPFEIALDQEVVYREEDRERSLAFKLFRDGVRKLSFSPGVTLDELLRFLQILAVRFTGVRQAEDDVVTLLRKAELRCIGFSAVEGYAPEDEAQDPGVRQRGGEPPAGFDTPFPKLPPPGPIAYRPLPTDLVAALQGEEAPQTLAGNGLRLAAELVAWAERGVLPAADVGQYCAELRDFLVVDGQAGLLATLADLAHRQKPGALRDELLRGLADPRLLDVVLGALPAEGGPLPPEALRLVPYVPAAAVLDRVAAEELPARRAVLIELVGARLPADAGVVAEALPRLPVEVARSLLALLAKRAPDRADETALSLVGHPDPALRVEALRALASSAGRVPAAPLLAQLSADEAPVRIAAAEALAHHGDTAAARALADALTSRKAYARDEAVALGRALGGLHAGAALRLFEQWLAPKRRLLGALRANEHEELLRWAAVAGLGAIPGPDAELRLDAAAKAGDEALRRHCAATLARRRAEGRRHG
jgi:hypothetical protein